MAVPACERKKRNSIEGDTFFWLAPFSPWLLAFGFALRLTKAAADWRMELGR